MPTATMTKADLDKFVKTVVDEAVGTALKDRQKEWQEFQAKQAGVMDRLLNGDFKGPAQPKKRDGGIEAAQILRSVAYSKLMAMKGSYISPAVSAKVLYGEEASVTKALSATNLTEGGATIPETMSSDFIELLRPASVFRSLQPTVVPMDSGTLNISKLTGGAAAGYLGENQNLPKTQQVFGTVKATARKLGCLVPISNDLLRRSTFGVDAMVRDDSVAAVSQRSDLAFIRGDGTVYTPKGLLNWCPAANKFNANATVNLANVTTDLGKAVLLLVAGNVRMIRPGWLFSPRTWNYLMTVRDANGNFAFRPEMQGGTLWGWPFRYTSQIPSNLGGGTDESEIYLTDFADVVLAETTSVMVDASSEAAYFDGANVVAAFSQDQTVVRVIVEHDVVMRHDESIAMIQAVKWI